MRSCCAEAASDLWVRCSDMGIEACYLYATPTRSVCLRPMRRIAQGYSSQQEGSADSQHDTQFGRENHGMLGHQAILGAWCSRLHVA